jgi:hypothetical protein
MIGIAIHLQLRFADVPMRMRPSVLLKQGDSVAKLTEFGIECFELSQFCPYLLLENVMNLLSFSIPFVTFGHVLAFWISSKKNINRFKFHFHFN